MPALFHFYIHYRENRIFHEVLLKPFTYLLVIMSTPMKTNHVIGIMLGAAGILLIPLIAMQFTSEVNWTMFDFVFAWVLLTGAGLSFTFVSNRSKSVVYKAAAGLTVFTALFLIWANGAVGIIGNEDNPANLLYGAVLATLFLGSIIAGLKARPMSYVLYAAALVHALVPVAAFIIWRPSVTADLVKVFAVSSFFVVLWLGAGLLFRRAGMD